MKNIVIAILFLLLAQSVCSAAQRIVLVDGDGVEINSSNPLYVQGV